jgi:hypothetical protein
LILTIQILFGVRKQDTREKIDPDPESTLRSASDKGLASG